MNCVVGVHSLVMCNILLLWINIFFAQHSLCFRQKSASRRRGEQRGRYSTKPTILALTPQTRTTYTQKQNYTATTKTATPHKALLRQRSPRICTLLHPYTYHFRSSLSLTRSSRTSLRSFFYFSQCE